MSQRVIRLAQLASTKKSSGILPVSQATIWRWVRDKKFPAPFKLGEGTTVWSAEAVEEFVVAQQSGIKK